MASVFGDILVLNTLVMIEILRNINAKTCCWQLLFLLQDSLGDFPPVVHCISQQATSLIFINLKCV